MEMEAPARIPIELRLRATETRRTFRLSRAISPAGIRFERDLPLPPGEKAEARFALPEDGSPITASIEIGEAEVRFLLLAPESRARIAAYCKERLGLS